jgi:diguanylate cyclase (GGDEF)-like protein
MLARLGERLREAVAPRGAAYRLGGDEFVVLVDGAERDEVTRGAAEALSSRGSGYELSAAWGVASVPAEAKTPDEAMRLADVRMYAQKESRRLADPLRTLDREAVEQGN